MFEHILNACFSELKIFINDETNIGRKNIIV